MEREKSEETIFRHANIRLCRLRPWPNYERLGFHILECSSPPHLISLVESNSPAAVGGLRIWDVLLAINNEDVLNAEYSQVITILKTTSKSSHLAIALLVVEQQFYHILKKKQISIDPSLARVLNTPLRMPEDYFDFADHYPRSCQIQLQSNERNFGFEVTHGDNGIGAYIQEVMFDSPAERAGLRKSDRIIKIDGKSVDKYKSSIIYEKLNKAFLKRSIKLIVMDTQTYRFSRSNGLDSVISPRKSTVFSLTEDLLKSPSLQCRMHRGNVPVHRQTGSNSTPNDHYHYEDPDDDHSSTSDSRLDSYQITDEYDKASARFFDVQNEPLALFLPIEGYDNLPLLSLSKTVENLERSVPKIRRNAAIALERSAHPLNGLTSDESASIQLYTMEWNPNDQSLFVKLNYALRAENRKQLAPYFPYLKLVLTALWKLQSFQTVVWRGVQADLREQYPTGKVFVWWGFSSCMESDKYLGKTGVRTLFHIECKTGKSVCSHSYSKQENEILLLPATQLQVINQDTSTDHLVIIYLKEIPPQYTLLQPPFDADYSSVSPEINTLPNEEMARVLQQTTITELNLSAVMK